MRLRESQPGETPAFEKEIQDDQLRMMFSCCHPELSTEAQVTLILRTLCGFSVSEIAHAFLANEDSIEKRLGRARKLFRLSGTFVELANASEISKRLEAVYQAIYLLFNEGYHSSHSERTVREDLCFEAIRLALLLSEHPEGKKPKTHALPAHHFLELSSFFAGSLFRVSLRPKAGSCCLFCPMALLSFANNTELSLVRNFFLRQLLGNQLLRPEVVPL